MRTTLNTLGWALFLAVSWTWCIGMYLPTLMVRDGGVAYFLAFLIPNVLGAASVGWVLAKPRRSRAFVAGLRPVLIVFTAVTVAFHGYFLVWRGGLGLKESEPDILIGMVLGVAVVLGVAGARRRVDWLPAAAAMCFTIALGVLLTAIPLSHVESHLGPGLVGLGLVTTLGFGLCPYLDLTFNRACQHARNPRAAFTVGFLVLFSFTILIATQGRIVWTPAEPLIAGGVQWIALAIGCHYGAQAAFTVAAHAAAVRRTDQNGAVGDTEGDPSTRPGPGLAPIVAGPLVLGLLLGVVVFFIPDRISVGGDAPMDAHELGYRFFLAAYGLVFPAWMLLCARGRRPMSRATLVWLVVTCLAALPFYWVGMIALHESWLIPGVGVVIAAAVLRWMTVPRS